ncbi:uncharacterized protein KY384_001087 [Bacidia gigantensis]|uniref:uncharacterized protein n=1 Tax=Bacidia gigantensis TaxID=2732470 RepID=UPI001D059B59|nr:uncharacterized protein KY384_001087 [Bacidia gigantensis]KAG8534243.1 hypothetical protein KY384_001087 [Bacidia gigantensis]
MVLSPTTMSFISNLSPQQAQTLLQQVQTQDLSMPREASSLTVTKKKDKAKQSDVTVHIADKKLVFVSEAFPEHTQKARSGWLTRLWAVDDQKMWYAIAKSYSMIRDAQGKDLSPLRNFLKIITTLVRLPEPSAYVTGLGYEFDHDDQELKQVASNTLRHCGLRTRVTIQELLDEAFHQGYTAIELPCIVDSTNNLCAGIMLGLSHPGARPSSSDATGSQTIEAQAAPEIPRIASVDNASQSPVNKSNTSDLSKQATKKSMKKRPKYEFSLLPNSGVRGTSHGRINQAMNSTNLSPYSVSQRQHRPRVQPAACTSPTDANRMFDPAFWLNNEQCNGTDIGGIYNPFENDPFNAHQMSDFIYDGPDATFGSISGEWTFKL